MFPEVPHTHTHPHTLLQNPLASPIKSPFPLEERKNFKRGIHSLMRSVADVNPPSGTHTYRNTHQTELRSHAVCVCLCVFEASPSAAAGPDDHSG